MSDNLSGWDWFWLCMFAYIALHALWSGFLSAVAAIGRAWRGDSTEPATTAPSAADPELLPDELNRPNSSKDAAGPSSPSIYRPEGT